MLLDGNKVGPARRLFFFSPGGNELNFTTVHLLFQTRLWLQQCSHTPKQIQDFSDNFCFFFV